jgi:hypothetical protein
MVSIGRTARDSGTADAPQRVAAAPAPDVSARADGLHVLEPRICSVYSDEKGPHLAPPVDQLDILYNEVGRGAGHYPLELADGRYFSEALGEANPEASQYEELINRSLELISAHTRLRRLSIDTLYEVGQALQQLDRDFGARKIGRTLDSLHSCMGTDADHPYAKVTICRTAFPVEISGRLIPFFYEKFLVAYSYLDELGRRRSTLTPAHSHPINFETGYFTHFGPGSCVIEQEFDLTDARGERIIGDDHNVTADFSSSLDWNAMELLRAQPAAKTVITPQENPTILPPFASEGALKADRDKVIRFDGLFRAHRVEVIDDPKAETRYFALDNYFGPACRVLVFDDAGHVRKWQHHEWTGR